jgi:hypothetical protein
VPLTAPCGAHRQRHRPLSALGRGPQPLLSLLTHRRHTRVESARIRPRGSGLNETCTARVDMCTATQGGRSVGLKDHALALASLAKRAQAQVLRWNSRSLRTRAPFPDCLGPISGTVRDHNDNDGWGWRLMYGLDGEVHDLVERRCEEIDAKVACPVGTGRLRDSTEHEVDSGTVGIGNDDPYAGYIEETTRYLAAEPFLRPSLFRMRLR